MPKEEVNELDFSNHKTKHSQWQKWRLVKEKIDKGHNISGSPA
jgi:hypothetical protein